MIVVSCAYHGRNPPFFLDHDLQESDGMVFLAFLSYFVTVRLFTRNMEGGIILIQFAIMAN